MNSESELTLGPDDITDLVIQYAIEGQSQAVARLNSN